MTKKPEVQIIKWYIVNHHLYGDVIDHPRFKVGQMVKTSRIISHEDDVIETLNTKYKLVGDSLDIAIL